MIWSFVIVCIVCCWVSRIEPNELKLNWQTVSLRWILIQLQVQEPTYWEKLLSCWFMKCIGFVCLNTLQAGTPCWWKILLAGCHQTSVTTHMTKSWYSDTLDTHWMVTFIIAYTVGLWHYVIAALLSNKFESGIGYLFLVLFILDPLLLLVGLLSQNCLGQMVLMRGGIRTTFLMTWYPVSLAHH